MDGFDDKEIYDGNHKGDGRRKAKGQRRDRKSPKQDSEDDQEEEEVTSGHSSDALRSDEIGIRMERLLKE